jgi:hypothetical protein
MREKEPISGVQYDRRKGIFLLNRVPSAFSNRSSRLDVYIDIGNKLDS